LVDVVEIGSANTWIATAGPHPEAELEDRLTAVFKKRTEH
jgi:hypothetical protein